MVTAKEIFEKYRPKRLKDIIGQPKAVEILSKVPAGVNLLFHGPPGTGKTSAAYAWANERGYRVINEYNASQDRGINVIRNEINRLAFMKTKRIILLDEADQLTGEAQTALRRPMEMKYKEVSFILTANYPTQIIDPIKSRCVVVPFSRLDAQSLKKIALTVLKGEKVKILDKKEAEKALIQVIKYSYGDARKLIGYLLPSIEEGVLRPLQMLEGIEEYRLETLTRQVITNALNGKVGKSLDTLQDFLVETNLQTEQVFRVFVNVIREMDIDDIMKSLLLKALATAQRGTSYTGDLALQLAGFVGEIQLYRLISHEVQNKLSPPPKVEVQVSAEDEFTIS